MKTILTITDLILEAKNFCIEQSKFNHTEIIGITDGKAVGTYVEHKFKKHLLKKYELTIGNSAFGIDLPSPSINTDIKVTSLKQPQSSCPYKSARDKIYGLGYNLLIFIYDKVDAKNICTLKFKNCSFVYENKTADFTTTKRLREIIDDGASIEDIIAYFEDRNLPGDDIIFSQLAEEIIRNKPEQGYLTISNALQWRLQYKRVMGLNNSVEGVKNFDL